jgi:phosphoenolpyruvate-protein kinase (PTS system EI component)
MSQKFKFYQDAKCTIWQRAHFTVTAGSYEDAVKKMTVLKDEEISENEHEGIEFLESEMLFETAEHLPIEENQGHSTLEIFHEKNGFVAGNGKPVISELCKHV